MPAITVDMALPNPVDLLKFYDQIRIYRCKTGPEGSYTEITTVSTRIPILADVTMYAYTDLDGDDDYYYKMSYYNTTTLSESEKSGAIQGKTDPALSIISIETMKTVYLFGLDLTDDSGTPYPDLIYSWAIKAAVEWLEKRLDIAITPKFFDEERHDYIKEDYNKWIWLQVDNKPVLGVDSVKLVLPSSQVARDYPREWIHVQKSSGQINIIPALGSLSDMVIGAFAAPYALAYGAGMRMIPDAFRIKYSAGFEEGQVPADLADLIGKIASFGPLNIAGDLLGGAGIASQSISLDGISQSFNTTSSATNAGYGARLVQYNREIKAMIPSLYRYYNGAAKLVVM